MHTHHGVLWYPAHHHESGEYDTAQSLGGDMSTGC